MREPTPWRGARSAGGAQEPAASQAIAGPLDRLRAYLLNHRNVAADSLARLIGSPASSMMTWLVIGIALAMPIWMYLVVSNAQALSVGWHGRSQVSIFLKGELPEERAQELSERLLTWEEVESVQYLSPGEALAEFRELSGYAEIVDSLPSNPLPAVLVVAPSGDRLDRAEALFERLHELPEVESVSLDMQWVRRLYAMLQLAERVVLALAVVLASAVTLVIGNTVRLAIESRREEIEVVKLVGGTDAFVRRPFLYAGFWFGAGGGSIALILVQVSMVWMAEPIRQLIGLYSSEYEVIGLDPGTALLVLVSSGGLGLAGAWLAVNRHLAAIDPR